MDTKRAEAVVAKVYELFDADDYAGIYKLGSPDLKASASQEHFERLVSSIDRKTAGCKAPQWAHSGFSATTNGSFTTLVYTRDCPNGVLTETFVVKLQGEQTLLHGYNANAAFLIMDDPPSAPAQPTETAPSPATEAVPT